jgi:hypothetical protein
LETITYPSWADPSSFLADGTSHGTNVAGIYGSRENGFGTTGIAHDADLFFASSVTAEYGFNMPNAILNATVGLDAGDIICLEHHIPGPNSPIALDLLQTEEAFVPVEWDIATYDTILLATTLGRIVVEAAGNGSQNLDGAEFTANFGVFTHAPFAPGNRSGAIIVGAGRSPLDGADSARTRHGFSNFGSRVDVHGWGDRCVTTGPLAGNTPGYWGTEGADLFYINNFNGTSSATPVVVGVAACVQGVFKENYGRPLTPFEMGNLLFRTGREQVRRSDNPEPNPIQNIGPLVDLHGAVNSILGKCEPPVIVGAGSQAAGQQTDVSFVFGLGTSRFNSAIRFTLDGSTPTQNSPVWNPDTTITITESTTVKARTFTTEFHPITGERNVSETAIRGFTFEEAGAGETVFDPPAGTYEHTIEVDIDIELPEEGGLSDAIILYNIDQDADPSFEPGNPTNSFFYFGEFTLTIGNGQSTEVRTVKARLYGVNDNGQAAYGPVYTATYTLTP